MDGEKESRESMLSACLDDDDDDKTKDTKILLILVEHYTIKTDSKYSIIYK